MDAQGRDLEKELLDIERGGWASISQKNPDYYRNLVIEDTIVVDDEGAHKGSELVDRISEADVESSVKRIGDSTLIPLTADSVAITYRIDLEVLSFGEIAMYASSVYVRRDGAWKLALHQQTQIPKT
jgi:hypothetical protein